MTRYLSIVLLTFSFLTSVSGAERLRSNGVFLHGEELTYKVKWNFIRLGTVVVRTVQDTSCSGLFEYKIMMSVHSNPDLSFIWIHEYNESLFDALHFRSKRFYARHRNGEDYYAVTQVYDQNQQTVTYTRTDLNTGAILSAGTLQQVGGYVEGPSLLFLARCIARCEGQWILPTMVEGRMSTTELQTNGTVEEVEIDAAEYPVRTRTLTGFAHWTGGSVAGMSGDFKGWMSDDEAAIPVQARIKILLGSITLELEKWVRPGWMPPDARDVHGQNRGKAQ